MDKYPLGPLPVGLINYLIRGDPQLYSSLARTSSRLNSIVRQSLPEVCLTPIRVAEIIRYLKDPISGDDGSITLYTPEGNFVTLQSSEEMSNKTIIPIIGNIGGQIAKRQFFLDELPSLFSDLTRLGLIWLDLKTIKNIASLRTSCLQQDPNYPLKFVWNTFQQRREKTEDLFVLEDLYRQMADILRFNPIRYDKLRLELEDRLSIEDPDISLVDLNIKSLHGLYPILLNLYSTFNI